MTQINWPTSSEEDSESLHSPREISFHLQNISADADANKIVVEVTGRHVDLFCHESIGVQSKKNGNGQFSERLKIKRINGMSDSKASLLVEIPGMAAEPHDVFIVVGCSQAYDACYKIPLQNNVFPVAVDYDADHCPTSLIPIIPLAFTEPSQARRHARPLRDGWLYIYLNGHLWRELAACADGSFRDVNFELAHVPGEDRREPSGHAVSEILVPHRIDGRIPQIDMAYSEVQWSWDRICAMGGPAQDDPRFEKKFLLRTGSVPTDPQLREKRFTRLNMADIGTHFDKNSGPLFPVAGAPVIADSRGKDVLARFRDKKIAAVQLDDSLGVARNLAAEYQDDWREMADCLQELANTPERDQECRLYAPPRWFDAAVVANHFFFSPFPEADHWRTIHTRSSHKTWDAARRKRRAWAKQLDRTAIDEALGSHRREALKNRIRQSKQRLVAYLRSQTRQPDSPLLLMLDDYLVHSRHAGNPDDKPYGFQGYLGAWHVMEQVTARLADHPGCLDAVLEAAPVDTFAMLQADPGVAFLADLADPDKGLPLFDKLFPKPATDNESLLDALANRFSETHFSANRFKALNDRQRTCLAAFASHYTMAVLASDNPRVCGTLLRFLKAVFSLDFRCESKPFEQALGNTVRSGCTADRIRTMQSKAREKTLRLDDMLAIMNDWHVFGAQQNREREDNSHHSQGLFNGVDELSVPQPGAKIYYKSDRSKSLCIYGKNGLQIGETAIDAFIDGNLGQWTRPQASIPKDFAQDLRTLPVDLISFKAGPDLSALSARFKEPWAAPLFIGWIALLLESANISAMLKALRALFNRHPSGAMDLQLENFFSRMGEMSAVFDLVALSTKALLNGKDAVSKNDSVNDGRPALGVKNGSHTCVCSAYDAASALCPADTDFTSISGRQRDLFCMAVLASPLHAVYLDTIMEDRNIRAICASLSIHAAGAMSALLTHLFRDDHQIRSWLNHGPFSYTPYPLAIISEDDKNDANEVQRDAEVNGALKVDSQGRLVAALSDKECRLLQTDNTLYLTCRDGKPIRKIAAIGEAVDPTGMFKDPSCRFGGHMPGDTDFGVPEGGCYTRRRYPGTTRTMEFWQEPDGSFLWIDEKGCLFDYKLNKGGRLFEKDRVLFVRCRGRNIPIGKLGTPLRNRSRLLVDRKYREDILRQWCEEPGKAADALLSKLFVPQIQLGFSCKRRKDNRLPDADPYKGYDYVTIVLITLPCFLENRSRLWVQLWEQYDAKPVLIIDERIFIVAQHNTGARQLAVTWPLDAVYARHTRVTARVRLDVYGDGTLCLPLVEKAANGGFPARWSQVTKKIDKFSLRASSSPTT